MIIILTSVQNLFSIIPFAGILTFGIYIIKMIVNSVTAHELDRLFSTPWNKFVEMSIAILLVSLSYFVLITTEIFKIEIVEFIKNPRQGLLFTIPLLTIIIWTISSLIITGNTIYKTLCKQFVYYIKDNNGDKWKVEKSVSNERFYVSIGNKKKVIKVDENTIFENYTEQGEIGIKIYSKVKSKKILFYTLYSLMLIFIATIFITCFIKIEYVIVVAPIAIYIVIILMVIKIGYDDYLELNNSSTQPQNIINEQHS